MVFSAKIIALTASQLEQQSTFGRVRSEISFQNQIFVEGPSFSKQHHQTAIEYCHHYIKDSGLLSLLVESDFCFTVWLAQLPSQLEEKKAVSETELINWSKSQSSLVKKIFSQRKSHHSTANQVSMSDKELFSVKDIPLPPITQKQLNEKLDDSIETDNLLPSTQEHRQTNSRTYRGVSYSMDSSSSEAPDYEQFSTSKRTYRGLSYDAPTSSSQQASSSSASKKQSRGKKYRGQSY